MNAEDSLKLARRFIGLPLEKRQVFLQALQKEGVDFSRFPIPAGVDVEDRQALSYAQQRMWFLWQLDPASGAYNLPGAVRLKGALSLRALEQAFASLVARHETLRTVFRRQADDRLLQVAIEPSVAVEPLDFSALGFDEREQAVNQAATRQSLLPFDLENGPLLRVQLLKLDAQEHVLLLTLHHIVSDGWSMNVLIDEFIRCYDAHERHETPQLPALPIQYSDYALWQRRWLEAGEQARQLEYWQARLGDEHPVLELPTDRPRPAMPSYQGTRHNFAIDSGLAAQLRSCAQKHNVTLFMLLLGAFNVLLHRYTGQGDIRVGVPIANRNRSEVEGLIGFFVNTQVLRTELTGQTRVAELLQGIKEHALGAQAHQELPFERLVEALKVERSLSHTPLFQVMYNHQPVVADIATVSTASGLELALVEWQGRTTQFDLTLDTYEKSGTLQAALTYANDLFDAPSITRMAQHWISLLQAMVSGDEHRIGELPMLAADEQQVLVQAWNQTAQAYPTAQGVHRLIEEQVQRTPDAPALVFGATTLSYAQLDARANQLAHALREQGVGPDVLVGICVERSVEMVVGLLATLKAGGAYVPLDPEYPQERLAYMIEDSGIKLLLSQQSLQASLPINGVQVIVLDQAPGWLDGYSRESPAVAIQALNLAYVIYTSGSTGKPKGAGNSHRALVNRLCWMQQAYGLDASDAVLQKTPFSFDVSVWEFFWPLMTGARLVVAAPGEHREPARLIETIGRHAITTLHFVPSMLQAFIHEAGVQACTSLKRIVCSGEALPLDAQLQVFAKLPATGLFNLYGPTEAAIDVTHWTCVDEGADSVPIGRPIANLATYVLDAQLNLVPAGVSGELYLGGVGLARSYHRRPGLTAERFVPSPFVDGERLYRTGDRVRQRADGVIEYLGRLDHQVKLRGLRIELGEIETRLIQHPQVREAVVLVQGGKQLVAYLVNEGEAPSDLKAWLLSSLPEYMVPTHFVTLAKLPVTANGKLDRKALPLPDAAPQQAFIAPENALQKALAAIWSDVLGAAQVGLDDNFFELGGDSIISIQVVSRARQAGIRLSPRDLFQYQSVRSLALVASFEQATVINQEPVSGEVILTPVQHSFFEQVIPARQHWNQSLLLAPREALEPARIDAALTRLINHHDALRLRFVRQADGWQQAHAEPVASASVWQAQVADEAELAALCDKAHGSLNLEQGPLLRAVLVSMADGAQRLLLVVHHLVVDGVSWRILLEDLQQAYRNAALPAKTSAYQDWAQQLQAHALTLDNQLPYWQAQTASADLPCDNPQGGLQNRLGSKLEIRLSAEHTRQLLQDAPAAYRTQVNDLLLTALARVVSRWSGQPAALIQLEGHGREDLFDTLDLSRTVGWFTSLFPVRLQADGELSAAIKSVKEQLRAVPHKGIGYGLLRYLGTPDAREALSNLAAPRITFNYLGQFDRQFNESALFVPATQGSGQAQDPEAPLANWLTVEGQVYGGELALQWGFSREMFEVATVQQLADDYQQELLALIAHCVDPKQGGLTPADVTLAQLTQPQLDELALPARDVQDLYPLSPMQQGMLFHSLYQQGEDDIYVSQLRADVHGLDVAVFQRAWAQVLARHDMLRTGFVWQDDQGQALQVVHRQVSLPFTEFDWRGRQDLPAALGSLAAEHHREGFELARPPLLRVALVRTAEDRWHLIYTSHHILMDGWSNALVLNEVLQACKGQALAPVGAGFSQHIAWLQQQDPALGEAFWRQRLAQLDEPTHLARSVAKSPAQSAGEYGEVLCEWDAIQTQRLAVFARAHQVTLNTLVQSAWLLLLQRYTGQSSVACGVTVSGRPAQLADVEQQVGLFINTLPLIAAASPAQSVSDWVRCVQALNLEMREHEHTPLFDIQRWAGSAGEALFDTLVVFENFPVAKTLEQSGEGGLRFSGVSHQERTNYPLTLTVHGGERLSLHLEYLRAQFATDTVQHIGNYLQGLLQQFIQAPEQAVGAIPLLLDPEYTRVLQDWNPRSVAQTAKASVLQRFEQQAALHPQNIALILDQQRMTYADLNLRANRLAHRLIALGVSADTLVGVAVDRSLEMIVGLLAVLKSGGAYVPLDPKYPAERLQCMIEDSGLQLLLTQQPLVAHLPISANLTLVCLESGADWLADYSAENPVSRAQPANLAYVMFTSGSTGRPKGVGIDLASLARHVEVFTELFALQAHDRVLQFGTFNFDGFVEQLYPALCCGAAVVVRGGELWDSDTFYQQLIEHDISVVDLTTAYWLSLVRDFADLGPRDYGRLRQLHIGGEAMPPEGLNAWRAAGLQHVRLLNTYGPTEATVTATALDCAAYVEGREALPSMMPIGRVLDGRAIYLLDANLNPVPVGVAGELVIGGPLLARGYFKRADLTAHRFIPDPFCADGVGRLYRTGDLARYRADGMIEYVGRIDHQVKVRGFRIELGEIEARLLVQASVREALVIAADNQLVGYIVASQSLSDTEQAQLRTQLKAALRQELPDYMVPAHLLVLERLPLSPNGKLDRAALPKPDTSQALVDWVAPVTETQQRVAAIWAQVLGAVRVGLNDHFFEMGGHSLLATQVVSRLRHGLGLEVALRTLFEQPVLGDFVNTLAGVNTLAAVSASAPAMVAADRDQPLLLSYAQERQWFLWQLDPHSSAYHVPSALRLKGPLDRCALQRAFDTLVARHDSLRTHFQQETDRTVQVVSPQARIELAFALTDQAQLKSRVQALVAQPFDLRQGPLMRVSLLRLAEDEHVLVLVQHHIISDGWSMQVMVDELVQLYTAYSQGQALQLPAMPIQYADYAKWQRDWMEAGEKARQLDYWRELLGGEQPVLELPFDHQRPAVPSHRGARLYIALPAPLLDGLKSLAQREGVTLFMLLLASYHALLHRYSGQRDIRVGVPIANRNRVETERLIGFFVNTQVLKAEIDAQTTVAQLLQQVKQRALEAQAHQDLPFEQLVEALQPERSLSLSPLFQVAFNHHISQASEHLQRLAQLDMSPVSWDETAAHFDLTLDIEESRDQLSASLSYATDLFEASTIERMARHWHNLLQAMVADQQQPISQLNLLSQDEQQHILQLWNQADAGFSAEHLVHEMFANRARENPDAVAVKFDTQTLTYGELDRQANRLAHALIARGVGPEVRVAIAMPRSAQIMVAFLAVMKAGGVYVPLDIEYPRDRLLYMMQDSRAKLLLSHSSALAQLPVAEGLETLAIDRTEDWTGYSDTAPQVNLDGDNLAYVIYTSGSTGMPKGVAVSHGPLVAHIIATGERYETSPADCELHFMSFAFDGSHEGWMHPLINGASVLIRDDSLWLPEYTYAQMHRHHVTMAVFPPVYLQQLAEHAERDGNPPNVRVYCFGGDAVAQASYDLAWRALKPTYLFNGYGPTETVVTPLLWKARRGDPCGAVYAPIGTLLGNRSGYVLDSQLNLQPIGVAGELYLGGEGVARGYLERPALTAERFVPDPFGKPGNRVYRSGDLTRGRADGVVDYLGRVDHQVKIRGFRIELGEIEARLREQDSVGETVVVAQEGQAGKQLVAYVVPATVQLDHTAFRDSLRRALKTRLPDYMVPTHFMFLDQMPLTPNGKLDRKGLPEPDASLMQQHYVAPQTELEQQIAAIWAEILHLPRVGLDDNFFEVGGHSLLAIQITSRVQAELGLEVPLVEVFQTETLRAYAQAAATFRAGSAEDFDDLRDFLSELEAI
ncbi:MULTISPECIES: non-ribosomal peptide synthetase [unclassified Pseudomonas]|uniref:non-ribosomal peptide synthetase n=6 Tax=Pseudomonas TaxID=286 RepID=UPI001F274AA1|nr:MULTISPECIES: non-ribosomal peptide synthetase [unclassified Pseudomonas]MCF5249937.1 amino acid adenylation domain-containing protein [Pseudomonas sp. PA-5-4B]MCF5252285.1 amino acid adenylation domain-containing protein [Pseudomonas sp. PA-5-4B]MCF5262012.1 amino acid adenylation domain-containing protein [Pseudomonas sp. PA-5-4A]